MEVHLQELLLLLVHLQRTEFLDAEGLIVVGEVDLVRVEQLFQLGFEGFGAVVVQDRERGNAGLQFRYYLFVGAELRWNQVRGQRLGIFRC